ncbi:TlpA disulfide reductase family protein [Pedobacter sp. ASV1-7]|uniref:TlpA family protein disulfide reductase n=1 Tax=Pedobacter sp. ASV1-7 TaxID=3145237 RepID=UPI0032E8EAEA
MKNILLLIILLSTFFSRHGKQTKDDQNSNEIRVTIRLSSGTNHSLPQLEYWSKLASASTAEFCPSRKIVPYKYDQGSYYFRFKADSPIGYFNLNFHEQEIQKQLLYMYLVEPGDEITINLQDSIPVKDWELIGGNPYLLSQDILKKLKVNFQGKGSAKFQCRYAVDSNLYFKNRANKASRIEQAKKRLTDYQKALSEPIYNLLQTNLISSSNFNTLNALKRSGFNYKSSNEEKEKIKANKEFIDLKSDAFFTKWAQLQSDSYVSYLLAKLRLENIMQHGKDDTEIYTQINLQYKSEMKEKLLTVFLLENLGKLDQISELLEQKQVKNQFYGTLLDSAANRYANGSAVFNFVLPDKNGKIVRLSDYRDKIVYLDFWFTGCKGCAYFYQHELSKVQETFKNNPAVVFLTISVDQQQSTWLKSLSGNQYTSEQAINLYTAGQGNRHPVIAHYQIKSYPTGLLFSYGKLSSLYQDSMKNADQLTNVINNLLK